MADPVVGNPLPMLPEPLRVAGGTSPCVKYACRKCCFDTQMPLTAADVERLELVSGRDRTSFSVTDESGPPRLANDDGHCVFLNDNGCSVYEARPAGCRLYPLVLDPEAHRGVIDDDCPYPRSFRIRPRDRAALMGLVHHLDLLDEAD